MNKMKDIGIYSTKELVNELSTREGVEFMAVDVEDRCGITVDNEYNARVYSARRQGPEIVLRITD